MLTRESFLNAPPAGPPELVEVPALGGSCHVRRVTAGERSDFELSLSRRKGAFKARHARARIVAMVAVDASGEPMFGPDDIETLSNLPAAYLEPIIDAYQRMNSVSAEDLEALEKN